MTKDERYKAINVLYELKHNLLSERSKKQIDVVMKILCHEEEPCPYWDYGLKTCRHANIGALATKPYGDAVSRVEVIDELNRLGRNAFKEDTDYDNFFSFLDGLPPVTPIRPKGEWIEIVDEETAYGKTWHYECSKCGKHNTCLDGNPNFCPHCGADMRGET